MRVVLAMSGGVDSSAAAVLLQQQGYEVIGLFMRSGAVEETVCATTASANPLPVISAASHKQGCCSASDAADARRVADQLDIPFHALNFKDAFGRIKDYFVDEYLAGRTPNPCVMCNNWLKFGKLWDFARQVGAEKIATGHYARIVDDETGIHRPRLMRGPDPAKDQSYVLFGIDPDILSRILLPVGTYTKPEIRDYARQAGLRVAEKRDSQEICFIPDQDYAGFLERYRGTPDNAGDLVDTAGNVLGQHPGYHHYTIGQRKRLGITFGAPRYVVAIEPETRRVVIGEKEDLDRPALTAHRLNWLVDDVPKTFRCRAQIRYRHTAAPANATIVDEDELRVEFDDPQSGITPGQAVVLYDEETVLGGGWIST
ncbi:MAG: tRNA 2-thiouridine(34) synthase MnmA [Planctomycetota bacterium]|nr:tRNA 2-thiouridine(34) synthase MnmA [Planctomycetota bacterium]MDA1212736.1 tRNA 2-thiouridine(34) synthase MnmA [Planctomycetota bacterium]